MICRILTALGLFLMLAVIVLVLFWIISITDDMGPDSIFIMFGFTVVNMLYAIIRYDNLFECLLCIAVGVLLFVLNRIAFRSIRSLYCVLAVGYVIAALTNFSIAITIAIITCIVGKFRSLKERTK